MLSTLIAGHEHFFEARMLPECTYLDLSSDGAFSFQGSGLRGQFFLWASAALVVTSLSAASRNAFTFCSAHSVTCTQQSQGNKEGKVNLPKQIAQDCRRRNAALD
jgi:hypothetical protein